MNYYKLSDFTPITIKQLENLFYSDDTIRYGEISIYGDSIGKPGDNTYTLTSIKAIDECTIELILGNTRIVVQNPDLVISNAKVIGISDCLKIERIDENCHLVYEKENGELKTKIISGNHVFRIKPNQDALMIYTW